MQKWDYNIIGTHLTILVDTDQDCSVIFRDIESRLSGFEQKFSRFMEGNWLHNLNKNRKGILDNDAKNMLIFALGTAHETDGYFDPTVGKRLTELGYGVKGTMKNEQGIILEKGFGNYRDIEIVGDEVILHGDIFLEFGGVGKGYLIDVIKEYLENFPRFLINFGGDMYGRGGWKVGLESPFASDEVIGIYVLDDGFFACSAPTRRKWGDNKHHLIDPKTGVPAREVMASYIEGKSGITTDSYATALCVMPWDIAIDTLEKTPEISGVIIRHDGSIFQKDKSQISLFS